MEDINLKAINWNCLSKEHFLSLHQKLTDKKEETKKRKNAHPVVIEVYGQRYEVPYKTYERLKTLKTETSKERLRQHIILNFKQIEKL